MNRVAAMPCLLRSSVTTLATPEQAGNNEGMVHRAFGGALQIVRRPGVTEFLRLWATGITSPETAMRSLPNGGGPVVGATAVLTRFVATDLIETLPQALLGRRPFVATRLPIPPERHLRAQAVFLPAFGFAQWLLMAGVAHTVLRLTGHRTELPRVLDVIGVGMLIPMPALWISDTLMLATDTYRLPGLAVTHSAAQLWETVMFTSGLHAAQETPWRPALLAGAAASALYVAGGATLIR